VRLRKSSARKSNVSLQPTGLGFPSTPKWNDCFPESSTAALGRYANLSIATPMHSSQLCVAATARMAVRSVVGRARARCALHSYGVFRNLIISSPARKRLSLMSAAHIAGGVAATEQVLAVCRNMPFQMRTAARGQRIRIETRG